MIDTDQKNLYEVYIGRLDGEIFYIGHGKLGRHKHLNSGVSHIYDANLKHFQGQFLDIEVDLFPDKDSAQEREKFLISKYKPVWNVAHTGSPSMAKQLRSVISKGIKDRLSEDRFVGQLWYLILLGCDLLRDDASFTVSNSAVRRSFPELSKTTIVSLSYKRFNKGSQKLNSIFEFAVKDRPGVFTFKFKDSVLSNPEEIISVLK